MMKRVTKNEPCPICGKQDWCGISENGSVAICMRVPEGSIRQARNGGYVHRLRNDVERGTPWRSVISLKPRTPERVDLDKLSLKFERELHYKALEKLSKDLRVGIESLRHLRVGWDSYFECWTFPMTDPDDQVIGIRLRFPDGKKMAIRGGREGLFIPTNLKFDQTLLICEGPTDTAALLDLGFNAVGRPSCCGGTHLIVELVRRHWPMKVVIVSDSDIPGQRGANDLAETLVPYVLTVCLIKPPDGIKDARDWKRRGATASDIQWAIGAAQIKRISTEGVRV